MVWLLLVVVVVVVVVRGVQMVGESEVLSRRPSMAELTDRQADTLQ
jgi:hypothetical protein